MQGVGAHRRTKLEGRRSFLFLQGPLSPLYARVADALAARGYEVSRINLCIGDRMHWRRGGATDFRGRLDEFDRFVGQHIERHAVTDVVLHGECRTYHAVAANAARAAGARVFVTELGYLRPDWLTIDRDGTASASAFPRDPARIAQIAAAAPPVDLAPQFPNHFSWVAVPDVTYNLANTLLWFLYPHYQRHTVDWPPLEYAAWLVRLATASKRNRHAADELRELMRTRRPYFLLPLQLEGDFQLRARSPFKSQREALDLVAASLAKCAATNTDVLIKTHPLDNGLVRWRRVVARLEDRHGLHGRLRLVDGGTLPPMLQAARGLVTINSSAGLEAILAGKPTKVLAPALYDIAGLTHAGPLETFWTAPQPPDAALAQQLVRALAATVQVRGTIYSREGLAAAVQNVVEAILSDRPGRTTRATGS